MAIRVVSRELVPDPAGLGRPVWTPVLWHTPRFGSAARAIEYVGVCRAQDAAAIASAPGLFHQHAYAVVEGPG
jgi:hypothetical protein